MTAHEVHSFRNSGTESDFDEVIRNVNVLHSLEKNILDEAINIVKYNHIKFMKNFQS